MTSNALVNRLQKVENGFGIMTALVAIATVGYGGEHSR